MTLTHGWVMHGWAPGDTVAAGGGGGGGCLTTVTASTLADSGVALRIR